MNSVFGKNVPVTNEQVNSVASFDICVLLWAHNGFEDDLVQYENQVLELLPDYGAEVLHRMRTYVDSGQPNEVQILRFPSEDAMKRFVGDDRRIQLATMRDRAIERTEVLKVQLT
jgi:uncharacterized protein (DUF1330 family)